MGLNIKKLEDPIEFWDFFEKISRIPRCSSKEDKIREFIKTVAIDFNFNTKSDEIGNLLVEIPVFMRGNNNRKKVCLQCHMDMVCEKNESHEHDFSKDPLKLESVNIDGEKWLTAQGTTLGADNGVGIAYCLTLMKKIHDNEMQISNVDLTFLFTVDEESGLLGAFNIDKNLIECDYLINLDSESDNTLTIGCAGGINTIGTLIYQPENVNESKHQNIPYKISITGLKGGHSGVDIHRGRINAIKLISRLLIEMNLSMISLQSLKGGNRTNVIPREAEAIFFVEKKNVEEFIASVEQIILSIKQELVQFEPNLQISLVKIHNFQETQIIPEFIKDKLIIFLQTLPNGPISMHSTISNLVHTSTNLATIKSDKNLIEIKTSQRSLEESSKQKLREKIKYEFESTGLNFQIKVEGDYPGWNPDFNSTLLLKAKEKYKELFNKEVYVHVVHAGLECGILKKHYPIMDAVSLGPTIRNAHSPDESLRIKSINKIWQFLIELLKIL